MGDQDEIERLRDVCHKLSSLVDWLDRCPDSPPCDYKCGYKKSGDASECYCGRPEWESSRPPFVDEFTHKIS